MISLELVGNPVPGMRPRFKKMGNFVSTYDGQKKLKEAFKWQIRSQYRDNPLECPVYLNLTFFMPIPKSTSGVKKRQMLNGVCYHMKKPDIDNLQKFVLDCLNEVVLQDDSQIVEIRARKIYASAPGTSIQIFPRDAIGVLEQSK